jgi:hypothetical protein
MPGAASKMRSHLSRQGKKGNRKMKKNSSRKQNAANSRVGGYAGANFSNDIGRR